METINDASLFTRQRQSPVAILFILLKFLQRAVRLFWPLILLYFFNQGDRDEVTYLAILGVFALWQLIRSILSYFRYYFFIEGEELIIEKGVFTKTNLNIPFERIQTIQFEQNILHQFFQVVKVAVDTAGSSGSELYLDALSQEKAEQLRSYILERKAELVQSESEEGDGELAATSAQIPASKLVFQLMPRDLLKIGVSENHLRTAGIIWGTLLGLSRYTSDGMEGTIAYLIEKLMGGALDSQWSLFIGITILTLIAAFLYSLFRTVFQFYGLKLWQSPQGFRLVAGLLNRQEQSASNNKIQFVKWSTDPLKQLFRMYTMRLYQASSGAVRRKQAISIPGCYDEQVSMILQTQFSEESRSDYTEHGIHTAIIGRQVLYFGLIPAAAISLYLFSVWSVLSLLWITLIWWASRRYQRRWAWWLNAHSLKLRSGIIGTKYTLLHWHKIQAISIKESPYQRRNKLASVVLHTASGDISIPYIEMEKALELQNYLLYRVESEPKAWM